jgi:molybdopterin/thiamine biosynthesis adenylyltransferase
VQSRTLVQQRADAALLDELVPQADVVLDCSDNFAPATPSTPPACATACRWCRARPSASTARSRSTTRASPRPCYACLFPPDAEVEEVACATMGVFAPLVGIIGSVQAAEALKLLAGTGQHAGRPAADAGRAQHAVGQPAPAAPGRLPRCAALTARNFPSAEEEAAATQPPSRYAGPESAYRLAFTDTEFLLREELRPVRMQLELLKPEMVQQERASNRPS